MLLEGLAALAFQPKVATDTLRMLMNFWILHNKKILFGSLLSFKFLTIKSTSFISQKLIYTFGRMSSGKWETHPGKCKLANEGCYKFNGEKNENKSIDCG